jgi:hypothetical protein
MKTVVPINTQTSPKRKKRYVTFRQFGVEAQVSYRQVQRLAKMRKLEIEYFGERCPRIDEEA